MLKIYGMNVVFLLTHIPLKENVLYTQFNVDNYGLAPKHLLIYSRLNSMDGWTKTLGQEVCL